MRNKKPRELTVEELIEQDLYNTDRESSVIFKELIPLIRNYRQRIEDLENQVSGFKYDLDKKVDKQYRDY